MKDLTKRQLEVLRFIHEFKRRREYAPSIREMCVHFNFTSLRGVTTHLNALERKGMIVRRPTARSIRLTPAANRLLGEETADFASRGIAFVVDRIRRESDRHTRAAAATEPASPSAAARRRYAAQVLDALACDLSAEFQLEPPRTSPGGPR